MRSLSSYEVTRHKRLQTTPVGRLSLEDSHGDDAQLDAAMTCNGNERTRRPKRAASLVEASDQLLAGLRILARGDAQVTQLIDAYEAGCEERADILGCTDLTEAQYRNARRRLDRMVEALPTTIRDGAADALEVSYGY
ncbi:MAG: hypothetical protein H6708_27790 [Kofleriaceae bacterium]|nr:hypothetical protein [Myxococcales bacterium]MCB9564211.1 hypothetical protein [Kofleriaceae bacterium]